MRHVVLICITSLYGLPLAAAQDVAPSQDLNSRYQDSEDMYEDNAPPLYEDPTEETPEPPPIENRFRRRSSLPQLTAREIHGRHEGEDGEEGDYVDIEEEVEEESEQRSGVHQHDGFYLRLALGGGYLQTRTHDVFEDLTIHGGSISLFAAVGGSIGENALLFADFYGAMIPGPSIQVGNPAATNTHSTSLTYSGFGVGFAYYLMPINIYFAGSIGGAVTVRSSDFDGLLGKSDFGFGAHISIGKEWWVGDDWGVGVAIDGLFGILPNSNDTNVHFQTFGGLASLSITYN